MNQLTSSPSLLVTASRYSPDADVPHGLRILHLEDNPADALLTQEYVRTAGADVEFDTVTRLDDVTPQMAVAASCAIVDLSLPDASGLEALVALRSMSEALPIIVLTGFDDLDLGLAAIRCGAEDYLVKNFVDGDSMQRAIRYAMERRRLTIAVAARSAEDISAAGAAVHTPPRTARGTHQVAVAIDADRIEYALRCESCNWEAAGSGSRHSWADRHLEGTLLEHVAFGSRSPSTRSSEEPVRDGSSDDAAPPISRRSAFSREGLFRSS